MREDLDKQNDTIMKQWAKREEQTDRESFGVTS